MLVLSVALHAGAIVGLVTAGVHSPAQPATPDPYIVSLVAPSALVPSRGGRPTPAPAPPSQAQEPSQAQATAKKPEPKPAAKKPVQTALKKKRVKLPNKKPKARKKAVNKKPKKTPRQAKHTDKKAPKKRAAKPSRAPKKPAVKAAKPQPSMSAQDRDARQLAEALDRVREAQALDRVRQNVKSAKRSARRAGGPRSAGGSGSGGGNGREAMAFVMYTAQVQQRVKDSWIVTHERAGLTAVVQFGIRPNGEITEITLARSSGNAAFDQSALRAVHHANPLPPPPLDHLHEFLSQKVQVAFGE